ncbi:hypothetical protein G3I01_01675 [Gramella sp. MT6]|uniref:hypothetical protein n=1 Tax=Gramella sp. MT6 TaxID=2705471 RepID=UPI001C604DF2|nr:hypothetical protein [Gramella sp. MT6]QYA24272.1 hypothetical protein G3I01_01675 [Gramella sp. MT6]
MLSINPIYFFLHIAEDQIIISASAEDMDDKGIRVKVEESKLILLQKIDKYRLRSIQTITAAPLLQSAIILLEGSAKCVILQSDIDTGKTLKVLI